MTSYWKVTYVYTLTLVDYENRKMSGAADEYTAFLYCH
jgi:hypothetical protein